MPPNTDGDEDALELEAEESNVDKSDLAEFQDTIDGTLDQADSLLFSTYPDRTTYQSLHRTDSHTSSSHELPAIIDSPTSSANLLPSFHDVLHNAVSPTRLNTGKVSESSHTSFNVGILNDTGGLTGSTDPGIHLSPPQDINISPFSSSAFSPNSSICLRWPVSNTYEARLFHHFIVRCTDWVDVCDPRCHFGKEVPKRAAQYPVIMNGILGLAARHIWLLGKVSEDKSQGYIDSCLQALIVALEDPLAHWDENFLVAVCCPQANL